MPFPKNEGMAPLPLATSFSLREGELLRALRLILSRAVVVRSWVSLICWKDFSSAGLLCARSLG